MKTASMSATEKVVFRVEEAAEFLGVSRAKVFQLLRRGELKSIKIDSARRITLHQLEDYLQLLESGAA